MNTVYKVEYTKMAEMQDGSFGNLSQGDDVAFLDCKFDEIEQTLNEYLFSSLRMAAVINKVERIKGHLKLIKKEEN